MATRKTHQEQQDYSKYSRCFSTELKKEIVRDIERGALSISEISKSYSVSRTSIYRWIYRYSRKIKKGTIQIVEKRSQTKRIAALQARIKDLEHLVGVKQIQLEFSEKMVELGSQEVGFDLKKKYASKASSTSGNIEKK
jgi:transposase-like protein